MDDVFVAEPHQLDDLLVFVVRQTAEQFIDGGNIAVDAPTPEFFGNISNRRLKDFISKVL